MGTLVTTLSLNSLQRDASMQEHLDKIHQLILGASDIDQEEFRNTILPEFKNIGLRRTIYASDHDYALGVSSWGRRGRLRLGQIGKDIFVDPDIDTIEASNIEASNSHGYIFESKLLLTDLFYLITKNLNPAQRRLREVRKNLLPYWLFLE
jgi:esterase/lipase superfamily enzyme